MYEPINIAYMRPLSPADRLLGAHQYNLHAPSPLQIDSWVLDNIVYPHPPPLLQIDSWVPAVYSTAAMLHACGSEGSSSWFVSPISLGYIFA